MRGYHIYYQLEEKENQYEYIDFLCHLCSILFWKKNFGTIELICNEEYLKKIKFWGLDKYYDDINTKLFENIPHKEKLETFWSYPKIYAISHISKYVNKFCVLDTDLWIYDKIEFNEDHQLVAYHRESSSYFENGPYSDPYKYIKEDFDWSVSPVNCAFLYFNSKNLIENWIQICDKVISEFNSEKSPNSADTIFIEQRLLTSLCKKLNYKFSTLIENTYIPGAEKNGSEWDPIIGYTSDNLIRANNIKHVWGLKKLYSDKTIRDLIMCVCKISLDHYFAGWGIYNVQIYDNLMNNIDFDELEKIKIQNYETTE